MCCKHIKGDTYRRRHDTIKQHVVSEAPLAGVPLDCKVFGQFSDLLPANLLQDRGELAAGRQRQGKVPDFLISFPTPEGPMPRYAELKSISAGVTNYPRGTRGKGTDRRARRLPAEYEGVLRDFDVRFYGAQPWLGKAGEPQGPEPPAGPLLQRFRGRGGLVQGYLVAGPWGGSLPPFPQPAQAVCRAAGGGDGEGYRNESRVLGSLEW